MSRRVVDAVLDHSKAEHSTRLVLIALASFANEAGYAWPGMSSLMRRTRLGRSTVWTQLGTLRGMGDIALHEGPVPGRDHAVKSHTYRILVSGSERAARGGNGVSVSGSERAARKRRPALVSGSERAARSARVQDLNTDVQDLNTTGSGSGLPFRSPVVSGLPPIERTVIERTWNVNAEATLAGAHVSNGTKGDDSVVDLFSEDSQQPAAPVQAPMRRAAGNPTVGAPYVAPFTDAPRIRAGWLAILATLADHELHEQIELLGVAAGSPGQLAAGTARNLLIAAKRAGAVQRTRNALHRGDQALVRLKPTCPPAWLNIPTPPADLVEQARDELAALLRPGDASILRQTLDAAGWDEQRDGPVTPWLARLPLEQITEVVRRARDAQLLMGAP